MSWQAYVDTSLVGSGTFDHAAIFGVEGSSVWASSKGFTVSPQEMKDIAASFLDKASPKKVQVDGLHIHGQKFFVLKTDERSLYGKKEKHGVVAVKTKQAIIVAHYPETVQAGTAANAVETLADYLIGVG
ncbi:MAG: profilin, required for normal timing of actin polymerization in response to thermal stress, partial [Trizodia sp. TS-e1964]